MGYLPYRSSRGYPFWEVVSAFQKAIRRSQVVEACWWAAEIDRSGAGSYLWNRILLICAEDIGPGWPGGPANIWALYEMAQAAVDTPPRAGDPDPVDPPAAMAPAQLWALHQITQAAANTARPATEPGDLDPVPQVPIGAGAADIWALHQMWARDLARRNRDFPERLYIMHAVLLLASVGTEWFPQVLGKCRWVDQALWVSYGTEEQLFEIPDHALDMHTSRGRQMGRGWEHFEQVSGRIDPEADLGPNPFTELYTRICADQEAAERAYEVHGGTPAPKPKKKLGDRMFGLFSWIP